MDKVNVNLKQLSPEKLFLRQEQLPREEPAQDRLIATPVGDKSRSLLQVLSEAQHTPTDIPIPSDINLEQYHNPNTKKRETSGTGFSTNNHSNKKNKSSATTKKEETSSNFPASQSSSYTKYLNEISTQRNYSSANNRILHIENSETIKSNIEANRRLLWKTLVQDPALESLAKNTLTEYLNARPADNQLITFTFPPENESTHRVVKTVTPDSIGELKNDPDIQMSVLLAKAKTDPKLRISEDLDLNNILQIVDHMACISAWKDDSKAVSYPPNEPELRQVLDFSIRSTQVQKNDLLSPEILAEKQDHSGKTYESIMPLEEMFKKPGVINPHNLSKITEAFKNFSGLDLAKNKLLDIFSVPVDPDKPQWPNSSYIRTYLDTEEKSVARIAYMEPRLSDTRRPNSIRSGNENEAVSGQKLSPVNNYTSAVVNENIKDAQKSLSDLFNPDLSSKQNAIAEVCKNFEIQYPSIAKNPLILINDDKYCNSGVIQYLCFNDRFGEASEAVKRAMPKLTAKEDKKFLDTVILSQATCHDDINIKLCAVPQITSLIKDTTPHTLLTLSKDESLYLRSLYDLIAKKPELNKDLIEYLTKEPRKNTEDRLLVCDFIRLFYENQPIPQEFTDKLLTLVKKIQGEIIYDEFQKEFHKKYEEVLKTGLNSTSLTTNRLNRYDRNLGESSDNFDISSLYSKETLSRRLNEAKNTGVVFTQEEIHQSVKEYYEQGKNYKQK
jgi:hypothetical protein